MRPVGGTWLSRRVRPWSGAVGRFPAGKGRWTLAVLLVMLACPAGYGQTVGRVEDIKEAGARTSLDSTQAARLTRVQPRVESSLLRRNEPLFNRDLLRIFRSNLFVDVQFSRMDLESRVVLGTRRTLDAEGTYRIGDTTIVGLNRLQVVISQGILVIEQHFGDIEAVAAGIRTRIFGTTVLLQVDANDEEGLVFLTEGRLLFTESGISGTVTEGQPERAWRLQRGQAPVELVLTAAQRAQWRQEVEYNTRTVWQGGAKPFWKRPAFLIPAGVAVAALGGVALCQTGVICDGDESAHSRGRVIIRIPP